MSFKNVVPWMILGSFGDSWEVFPGDSCGFSEYVLAVSSSVLDVTDVSVSLPSVCVFGKVFLSDFDCETETAVLFFLRKASTLSDESKGDVNVASSAEDAQQLSRWRTQDVDCEVNKSWTSGLPIDCKNGAGLLGQQ